MSESTRAGEQFIALASYVASRRQDILTAWRQAVEADRTLPTAPTLPRVQLKDHIPRILDQFERLIRGSAGVDGAAMSKARDCAADHGIQRWQQGYRLHEVIREWGHLQMCLADELERYAAGHPELDASVMPAARRRLLELCNEGIDESTSEYFRLQQAEAAGQVRDIEQALAHLSGLEHQRAELWRAAAHDLRGSLGVVTTTTTALAREDVPEAARWQLVQMLQKSVSALHGLLEDLMSLARLGAGHEERQVSPFDAARLLSELCANMQPLARERHVFLKAQGPVSLAVEGDAIKVQRIVQNLVLNALRYTESGGVTVTWGESRANDPERWMLCIHDTGPGLDTSSQAPIAKALEKATQEARQVEVDAGKSFAAVKAAGSEQARSQSRSRRPGGGEGIGLVIVKRLCDLLDGSLEFESEHGKGATFRVLLPRRYETTGPN
jgi:signal transduction histidine kinase